MAFATNPSDSTPVSVEAIIGAVNALQPYMLETLAELVRAVSPSGGEWSATHVMESVMAELGMTVERIPIDSEAMRHLPLYSPSCHEDGGRYNLLSCFEGAIEAGADTSEVRSILFNGHLDVVPTGPEKLWTNPPYDPVIEGGWMYGRGSGDMKAGIVCTLVALKALRLLGVAPRGRVGFNWVLEEECTGNGALASVLAIQNAADDGRLSRFDAVIIPEPLGDGLVCAQVGVFWMEVELTGKPAHAAMMSSGVNPINAAVEVMADLRLLETEWNLPENRHPAYRNHHHPINFNLGQLHGGEWTSSVPCICSMGVRIGVYPGMDIDAAKELVATRIRSTVSRIGGDLKVEIFYKGFHAPGAEFDLNVPVLTVLAGAHEKIHGVTPPSIATTATTDARHFRLLLDVPVTCYGPLARNIHGVDEAVSIESMQKVSATLAVFLQDWCGVAATSLVPLPL